MAAMSRSARAPDGRFRFTKKQYHRWKEFSRYQQVCRQLALLYSRISLRFSRKRIRITSERLRLMFTFFSGASSLFYKGYGRYSPFVDSIYMRISVYISWQLLFVRILLRAIQCYNFLEYFHLTSLSANSTYVCEKIRCGHT